jgi:hypothetical protein
MRITYRTMAGPVGPFSPARRKQAFRRVPVGTSVDGARLKVWESEGGALSKAPTTR